jgi:hypothetical protein
MTTGEGIFYGLVFIGFIWLYVATRDRWKWKRIAKWSLLALLLPIITGGAWLAYSNYMENQPRYQSEFWGITPGALKSEIIFQKGLPSKDDDESLSYSDADSTVAYDIRMTESGKARSVLAIVDVNRSYALPSIQGIHSYSSLADIESKFGKAEHISSNKSGTRRLLNYLKYGIVVGMEQGKVTAVGVLDPKEGPLSFKDN